MTPQVSTSVKRLADADRAPVRLPPAANRIGLHLARPRQRGFGAGLATGADAPAQARATGHDAKTIAAASEATSLPPRPPTCSGSVSSSRLPQPSFGGEFHQRGFHLPAVQPNANHVEASVAGLRLAPGPATRPRAPPARLISRRDSTRVRPLSTSYASIQPSDTAGICRRIAHRPSAGRRRARR